MVPSSAETNGYCVSLSLALYHKQCSVVDTMPIAVAMLNQPSSLISTHLAVPLQHL